WYGQHCCAAGAARLGVRVVYPQPAGTRPVPKDATGKPAMHYTTVYKVFAKWADDGSLWQAFVASVAHLSAEKHLDLRVLHGDGTNTVAKKGVMGLGIRGTSTRKGRRSSL